MIKDGCYTQDSHAAQLVAIFRLFSENQHPANSNVIPTQP